MIAALSCERWRSPTPDESHGHSRLHRTYLVPGDLPSLYERPLVHRNCSLTRLTRVRSSPLPQPAVDEGRNGEPGCTSGSLFAVHPELCCSCPDSSATECRSPLRETGALSDVAEGLSIATVEHATPDRPKAMPARPTYRTGMSLPGSCQSSNELSAMFRPAASANARKSRSRVRRGASRSTQL